MRKITLLFILFYTATNFAQKQIPGIQIQETNLLISAEVDSPTRVTFKITPLGEAKAVDTMIITSFNNLTFKAMTLKHLKTLKGKNSESEYFKSEIYKYSDQDIESFESDDKEKELKDLEKAKDNVDFLFNYFDNQINILYKYDTEHVAGVLHFKKDNIKIQHFEDTAYEIYFHNLKRNYHKLIKKLFEKRLELVQGNKKDTIAIEDTLVNDIVGYFEKSKKDYSYEISNLEASEPVESGTTGDSSEQNSSDNPDYQALMDKRMAKQFLKDFKPLIEDFRSYNRNKRMEIIYETLLSIRNKSIVNEINEPINKGYNIFNKIRHFEKIKRLKDDLKTIQDSILLIEKSIKSKKNKIASSKQKFDSLKTDKKEKLNKAIYDLKLFYQNNSPSSIDLKNSIDEIAKKYEENKVEIKLDSINFIEKDLLEKKEIILRNEYYIAQKEYLKTTKQAVEIDTVKIASKIDSLKIVLNKRNLEKNRIKEDRYKIPVDFRKEYEEIVGHDNDTDDKFRSHLVDLRSKKDSIIEKINNKLDFAPLWYFKPEKIQLDLNDGFVEHIVIFGLRKGLKLPTKQKNKLKNLLDDTNQIQLKFTNNYPLGFSSSKDFDDFKEHKVSVYVGKHKRYEMRLGDLFPNYIQTLQNDRLNFSPKDQAVTIYTDQDPTYRELKKESSSKLLQVKVYSDFVGLNSSDPNGTFQLELEKYIPIYTKRKSGLMYERYFGRGSNIGFFNYIKPEFRWSRPGDKDDNDKLELQSINAFNGSESITLAYATHLDLMRFESLSVGADLNLFVFDFPTAKWRMEVNASGRYGVTDIVNNDTNVDDNNLTVNTWRFYPEFIFRLRPEERYGANLSLRPIRFNSVTDGFSNISSANAFTTTLMDDEQWLHQIEINAHFSPKGNKDNRFFFRYRYTNNASWEYNGFSEIQVGYSMSLKF